MFLYFWKTITKSSSETTHLSLISLQSYSLLKPRPFFYNQLQACIQISLHPINKQWIEQRPALHFLMICHYFSLIVSLFIYFHLVFI